MKGSISIWLFYFLAALVGIVTLSDYRVQAICGNVCQESMTEIGKQIAMAANGAVDRIFQENQWNMMARANELIDRMFDKKHIDFFGHFQKDVVDHMFNKSELDFWGNLRDYTNVIFGDFANYHLRKMSGEWQTHTTTLSQPFQSMLNYTTQHVGGLRSDFKEYLKETFDKIDEKMRTMEQLTEVIRNEMFKSVTVFSGDMKAGIAKLNEITDQMTDQMKDSTVKMGSSMQTSVDGMNQGMHDVVAQMLSKVDEKMNHVQTIADTFQVQINSSTGAVTDRVDVGLAQMQQIADNISQQLQSLSQQWSHLFMLFGAAYVLLTIFLHYDKKPSKLFYPNLPASTESAETFATSVAQQESAPLLYSINDMADQHEKQKSASPSVNELFLQFVTQFERVYTLFMWVALVLIAFESAWILLVTKGIAQRAYGISNVLHITLYSTIAGFSVALYFLAYAGLGFVKSCCQHKFKVGFLLTCIHLVLATLLVALNGYICFIVMEILV